MPYKDPIAKRACSLRYYYRHKEKCLEYQKLNKDRHNEVSRAWSKANPEKRAVSVNKWARENPEKVRNGCRRRRAKQAGAGGYFTAPQLEERIKFFGNRCAYCGGPYEHVDHAIPLAKGGTNWPANLRPSCAKCNTKKGAKSWRNYPVLI